MLVTVIALEYASVVSRWLYGHFRKLTGSVLCEQLHKSSPFNSTHHAELYPQHGDRIVTTVSATWLHPAYNEIYDEAVELALLPADVICACRAAPARRRLGWRCSRHGCTDQRDSRARRRAECMHGVMHEVADAACTRPAGRLARRAHEHPQDFG